MEFPLNERKKKLPNNAVVSAEKVRKFKENASGNYHL